MKKLLPILPLFLSFLIHFQSKATITAHPLFTDNVVLQRNAPLPIWGWGNTDEKLTITLNNTTITTKVTNGKWRATLPAMQAGGPYTLILAASNTITIKNVWIGDVWICSGQSNMEWALFKCINGENAVNTSTNPDLHIFNVPHNVKMQPDSTVNAKWVLSDPKQTKTLSAVGYWFLSKLQKKLGIPIGFINISFGGTVIESWLSSETLAKLPFKNQYTDPIAMKAAYDSNEVKIAPIRLAYQLAKDSAKKFGLPAPPMPKGLPSEYKGAATIYNGEIAPIAPFAVKGIAWYQGESNAYVGRANTYQPMLQALINSWRKDWNKPDLPFLIFQITPNRKHQTSPNESSGVAVVQEAQFKTTQTTPNTALVVTMDVADTNVHYLNKEPIGERAMKAALALAYNEKIEYCGPLFKSIRIEGNKAIIDFTHASNGLMADGDTLFGFTIAGSDKQFVFADAVIKGTTVEVQSSSITKPVAVRYGWADYPKVNLFNKEGIPASPFRTDVWELPNR